MLLFWFLSTAVREDSSAFFAFTSYGHGKQKNPTTSLVCLPWEMTALAKRQTMRHLQLLYDFASSPTPRTFR